MGERCNAIFHKHNSRNPFFVALPEWVDACNLHTG